MDHAQLVDAYGRDLPGWRADPCANLDAVSKQKRTDVVRRVRRFFFRSQHGEHAMGTIKPVTGSSNTSDEHAVGEAGGTAAPSPDEPGIDEDDDPNDHTRLLSAAAVDAWSLLLADAALVAVGGADVGTIVDRAEVGLAPRYREALERTVGGVLARRHTPGLKSRLPNGQAGAFRRRGSGDGALTAHAVDHVRLSLIMGVGVRDSVPLYPHRRASETEKMAIRSFFADNDILPLALGRCHAWTVVGRLAHGDSTAPITRLIKKAQDADRHERRHVAWLRSSDHSSGTAAGLRGAYVELRSPGHWLARYATQPLRSACQLREAAGPSADTNLLDDDDDAPRPLTCSGCSVM